MTTRFFQSLERGHFARLTQLAPNLSSLVIVALMAWLLADSTLALLSPANSEPAEQTRSQDSSHDPRSMKAASTLFGDWESAPSSSGDTLIAAATETKLPLHLIGVFVSDLRQASGAIIASGQGAGKRYAIGDKVPGNAILESVQVDSVMIRRGVRLERLSFPNSTLDASVYATSTSTPDRQADIARQSVPTVASVESADALNLSDQVEEYRALARTDPNEVLDQLGLQPVEADEEQGYRVGSLPDNDWIRQSGLQDGDILLSVNGRRLGNPSLDRLEIDNLFAEGQVRLEIQRGERRFFVSTKLAP
ncbi:MAG: hypothetical protein OXF72_06160 [Gammaproteobacteria bacterium]|nr:hypothetical protein [Gammaproteobacteria bacterium]MCY4323376.1 hypothetical protein [Gammaproteobacteria bacterium]